ncbi:hypothetical protein BDV12DRAFT_202524 [Aspergillus spectabilis]
MSYNMTLPYQTSTREFTRLALNLLRDGTRDSAPPKGNLESSYGDDALDRFQTAASAAPRLANWPTLAYAIAKLDTVDWQIGHSYPFIDKASTAHRLRTLYVDGAPAATPQEQPAMIWTAELALILAFGEWFQPVTTIGPEYFAKALTLLPRLDYAMTQLDLAVEVHALAALYYQFIDQLGSAYKSIGDAIRIARLGGLHHQAAAVAGICDRPRVLWSSLYNLSQAICPLVGAPSDIKPIECPVADWRMCWTLSEPEAKLTLHAAVSRECGYGFESLYGTRGMESPGAIAGRRAEPHLLMHGMRCVTLDGLGQSNALPNVKDRVLLLAFWCTILRSRPLVLDHLQILIQPDRENHRLRNQTEAQKNIVKESFMFAELSFWRLKNLRDSAVLGLLPLDVEHTYSAALALLCRPFVFPLVPNPSDTYYIQYAFDWLDEMSVKGNPVASRRKQDLQRFQTLLNSLKPRTQDTLVPSVLPN